LRAGQRWWIRWGIVWALGVLMWVGSPKAWAQERLQEEATQGRWLFPPGRIEVGAQVGGGFSNRPVQLLKFVPRLGYVLTQQEVLLPGSVEVVGEPSYFAAFEGRTAHGVDVAALLKYNSWTGTKLTPYLPGGGGLSYASIRVPPGGTNFNFTLQAGLGLHYAMNHQSTFNFEWRYQHFSNGDISPPNPSLNAIIFLLGFSVLY